MNNIEIAEILVFLVVFARIYILNSLKVNNMLDKMFALYTLRKSFVGYFLMFYILIVVLIEYLVANKFDLGLFIYFVFEMFIGYKYFFMQFDTNNKEMFFEEFIKSSFKDLSKDDFYEIKDKFNKPMGIKLYINEMLVFLFAIWNLEFNNLHI